MTTLIAGILSSLIVGGYLPFLLLDTVTTWAVVISMLTVAAGEAVVMIVIGIALVAVIDKTGLKRKLP